MKEREVEDGKQLLSILSHAPRSFKVIDVQKQRELHLWLRVTTVSIEHQFGKGEQSTGALTISFSIHEGSQLC